jgi:hypothetical protein
MLERRGTRDADPPLRAVKKRAPPVKARGRRADLEEA